MQIYTPMQIPTASRSFKRRRVLPEVGGELLEILGGTP